MIWYPYTVYHLPTRTYHPSRIALYTDHEFIQYIAECNEKSPDWIHYPTVSVKFTVQDTKIQHGCVERLAR